MDTAKIEAGVRLILEGVGEDPEREGLRETPARVARMYEEVAGRPGRGSVAAFRRDLDEGHEEIVLVGDIPFFSMCEHHLAPFFGKAHVATSLARTPHLRHLEAGTACGRFAKRPRCRSA